MDFYSVHAYYSQMELGERLHVWVNTKYKCRVLLQHPVYMHVHVSVCVTEKERKERERKESYRESQREGE